MFILLQKTEENEHFYFRTAYWAMAEIKLQLYAKQRLKAQISFPRLKLSKISVSERMTAGQLHIINDDTFHCSEDFWLVQSFCDILSSALSLKQLI